MNEIIEKLQNIVSAADEFNNEEKTSFAAKLAALSEVRDQGVQRNLRLLAEKAEVDPTAIRDFFKGFDRLVNTYINGGFDAALAEAKKTLGMEG